jgi:hypothetical protein
MFVAARLAAAERADAPAVKIALLRDAVAVEPSAVAVRVPLFRAYSAAARPGDAIEAIEPLLTRDDSLRQLGLSAEARARLAQDIGEAYQHIDRLPGAVRFLTMALEDLPGETRASIEQRIRTINVEIGRRAQNAARQPQIAESLDQPQLVRPRIRSRAAAQGGAR